MNIHLLDKQLLHSLNDETISFHDVMNTYNIKTTIANLPAEVQGFVYLSKKNNYHLVLNGNLCAEAQYKVFCHEIKHILVDMPSMGYIVGLDMQHEDLECSADKFLIG